MCHILDVAVVTQFCSLSMPYFIVHHIIYCTEINFLCLLKENLKLAVISRCHVFLLAAVSVFSVESKVENCPKQLVIWTEKSHYTKSDIRGKRA